MSKIIVLSRCSTPYQDLSQQTDAIMKQVYADGYTDNDVILIEDLESGYKLKYEEREGITKLIDTINNVSDVKCVYCYEISRIARRPDVFYKVREILIDKKIQLHVLSPEFCMLNEDGSINENSNLLIGIFLSMAESESRIRVQRTMRGKMKLKAEQKWCGGWIKFGYTVDKDNRFIEDPMAAQIVRDIYDMYLNQDLSYQSIAQELIEQGKLHYSRLTMGASFISKVLNAKEYHENKLYPPLVPKEYWEKVQEIKKSRLIKPKTHHKYIYYCDKLIYSYDGHLLTGVAGNGCYRNKEFKVQVSLNLFDSIAWELTKMHRTAFSKESKADTLKKLVDDIATLENKIDTCDKRLLECKTQIERIETRLIKGKISEELAERLESEIESDIEKINRQKAGFFSELSIKNKDFNSFDKRDDRIVEELESITDDTVRRNLIHEEIKKIIYERIDKRNLKIHVLYVFDDEFTVYDLETRFFKLSLCGIDIPFQNLNRYSRARKKRKKNQ